MAELTFNPQTKITVTRCQGEVVAVTAAAPVRGRPLQVVTFSREKEPVIFDLLRRVATSGGAIDVELDDAAWERLAEVGLLVPEDQVSAAPRFRCSPRELPLDLGPRRVPSGRLHVNPTLRYQDATRPPAEGPFAEGCAWAWVELPDVTVPSALSVDERDRDLFRRLQPGDPAPSDLSPELQSALAAAGVLVDLAEIERRREAWTCARRDARARLQRDRYAVVRGLIHPAQIAALRCYYRELIAGGRARLDDRQVPLRYWAHNEPLARFFHERLAGVVADLAGEPVKPSYVFFASYLPGAVLSPHRDRAQCAISISLLIDYAPDPGDVSPWPLWLGLEDAPHRRAAAIDLGRGDGLFYRGTELSHWRHALADGHTSTSLFLHYVPSDFTGPLD
jgi:hypothetical protein